MTNYARVVKTITQRRQEREGPTRPVAGQIPGWAVVAALKLRKERGK